MTGRARLTIGSQLVALFLKSGLRSVVPALPIRDATVVDVKLGQYHTVVLLIESPDLCGPPDATIDNAPDMNPVMNRVPAIELPAGNVIALQLVRIADRRCVCLKPDESTTNRASYQCPACLAKEALVHVPAPWLESVNAARRELGETAPEPDPGAFTDEVPGA